MFRAMFCAMLRANDLSGFVARDLSGFKLSPQRGIKHESDRVATGDSEDERGWPSSLLKNDMFRFD